MNRTLPLILTAALLLTACASAVPAQPAAATTSPAAARPPRHNPDAAASSPITARRRNLRPAAYPQFPVGHLLTLPQNQNSGPVWNTGDALYELRDASNMTPEALVLKTDYAALTQSVYCDIPRLHPRLRRLPGLPGQRLLRRRHGRGRHGLHLSRRADKRRPKRRFTASTPLPAKTPVAAVPDALPHHMQLHGATSTPCTAAPSPPVISPAPSTAGTGKMTRCRPSRCWPTRRSSPASSRFLTIRIEANEPFPNFGSTEQEKAILAHAVYVYAWLDPATGVREKNLHAPLRGRLFPQLLRRQDLLHRQFPQCRHPRPAGRPAVL